MTASLYKFYYRQYGIRRVTQLINPRPLKLLSLPRNSLFHYYGDTSDTEAIDTSISFLSMAAIKCMVDFTTEYNDPIRGAPRKRPFIPRMATKDFFKEHRNYRYIPNGYKNINNQLILFIQNHSYLNEVYKYTDLPMITYYKWFNTYNTIFNNINRIANESDKNQFIYIEVPENIPTFPIFEMYMNRESLQLLKLFDTPEKFLLLELWKWLDDGFRSGSVFSNIDASKLNSVNLIFKYKDADVLINLGYLNSFIKKQPNTTEFPSIVQYPNVYIKKLMLRFFINIKNIAATTTIEETESIDDSVTPVDLDNPDLDDNEEQGTKNLDYLVQLNNAKQKTDNSAPVPIEGDEPDEDLEAEIEKITGELETYGKFFNLKLREKGIHVDSKGNVSEVKDIEETEELSPEELKAKIYTSKNPEEQLRDTIETMAKDDSITVSEYKKFKKYINEYNASPSVYNPKKQVKDLIGYTEEDVAINKDNVVASISDVVIDKAMASMTTKSLDKDYLDKLYHKDIVNTIYNLQKANVIIKSHNMEIESSALGEYEYHQLELAPIDGAPSTVSFKIPVIAPDNTFSAGGNRYMLRKQRVD